MTRSHICHFPLWYSPDPQCRLPPSQWVHLSQSDLRSSCGSASGGPSYGRSRRRGASAGGLRTRTGCSWRADPRKTVEPPADSHMGTHTVTVILRTGNSSLSSPWGWRIMTTGAVLLKPPKPDHYSTSWYQAMPVGSPECWCHLGPESSRDKASPPASAYCCSTEEERPVKQATAVRQKAVGP